jgi:hypothetical protein
MTPRRSGDGHVRMPDAEFEALMARAAEEGAKRALADAGLDGKEAAIDVRDLRALLDGCASSAAPPCKPPCASSPPPSSSPSSPASR